MKSEMMHSMIDEEGWLKDCVRVPSPNFDHRPGSPSTLSPSLLVIHNISLPPGQFSGGHIEALFCNKLSASAHPFFSEIAGMKVSAHVLIDRGGRLTQFVPFTSRAWHAGVSVFDQVERCNDFSIGVELEGTDIDPYTDEQYLSLCRLTGILMAKYPKITASRIVGHCDIAPGRKTDPGLSFDWHRYLKSI